MASNPSRRMLLGSSSAAALGGLFAGFGGGQLAAAGRPGLPAQDQPAAAQYLPFYGPHQPGILNPAPSHAQFVGWNINWREGSKKNQLRALLRMVTQDASRLMNGEGVLADTEAEMAAAPSGLTLTVGLSQDVLDVIGTGSVGTLPEFAGDKLQERYTQTDLLIQFCSQDETVLQHAVRAVSKNLRGLTEHRFTQRGFMHQQPSEVFRNLFGQLDGVNNPGGQARYDAVFGTPEAPSWHPGGTTLALRRFEMNLDTWDEVAVAGRDYALGRRQKDGSPLSGTNVEDPVDLSALDDLGLPKIAANAHVALARPTDAAEVIHRRGYNFHDSGTSGLIFASFQRDPATSFIPLQQRLAAADALNTWTTAVGSALYAILPGIDEGMYLGEQLLD